MSGRGSLGMDRRALLKRLTMLGLAVPGSSLLAACGPPPAQQNRSTRDGASPVPATEDADLRPIRITQAVTSMAFLQNYVAQAEGFFREGGLRAEIVDTGGGGPDVQAVLAGDAEFTINDGAQVLPALAQGQELRAVLATLDKNVINVTMRTNVAEERGVSADSPYEEKIEALRGLKIGITGPGALTWQLARYNLIKGGMDPVADAEVVGLGGGQAVLAALEQGQVDVIYISVPLGEVAVNRGAAITLINNAQGQDPTLPSFMMEGLWTRPDVIEADPELVASTVSALRKANEFIVDSADQEVTAIASETFGAFDDDVLLTGVQMIKAAVADEGRWSEEAVEATQDVLVANDILPEAEFTLNDFFVASIAA